MQAKMGSRLAAQTRPRKISSCSSFLWKNLVCGGCSIFLLCFAILPRALTLHGVEASTQLLEDERSAPDYYDRVYEAARNKEGSDGRGAAGFSLPLLSVSSAPEDRNESNVLLVEVLNGRDSSSGGDRENTTTYRMAHITTFIPFSNGTGFVRAGVQNDAAAVLLAIKHFNSYLDKGASAPLNGTATISQKNSILDSVGLDRNCNVRLTTELFDSRLDPIVSTSILADDVLKRKHKPAAVVGAYRSGVTMPLSILSGVSNIPQISASSTSTGFDDEEQFPLFSRTCPSSEGEAKAAVHYYLHLGVKRVAVLFVTDAFGSATQKAFQDYAHSSGIETVSVAFPYTQKSDEISKAIKSLKQTGFRYIFTICFEDHYMPIMSEAHKSKITGDDYFWLFYGMDTTTFQRNAAFPHGSALYNATKGIGILELDAGVRRGVRYPHLEYTEPLPQSPVRGHDIMRKTWREEVAAFREYFRSKLPTTLVDGFDPEFGTEPSTAGFFLYDAVNVIGISMCKTDTPFFTGEDITPILETLSFDGASGQIEFEDTGTRFWQTTVYTIWNVVPVEEVDINGINRFALAPTSYHLDGWHKIPENNFIYASGTVTPPPELSILEIDDKNVSSNVIVIALLLMGMTMLSSFLCFCWILRNKGEPIVCASQPEFLVLISVGTFIMSGAILPLSMREYQDKEDALLTCMADLWLYFIGFSLVYSALALKARHLYKVYVNPEIDRVYIYSRQLFIWCSIALVSNAIILALWTGLAPRKWTRTFDSSTDVYGRPFSWHGTCESRDDAGLPFATVLLILNCMALLVSNYWSYRAMDLEIEYQENNYISFALGSVLEAFILGIPILALLTKEPGPKYFVSVGLILLTSFVVLCLIFIPKIRFLRRERAKQRERNMEQFVRNGPRANSDAGADFHDGSSFNGASSGDSLRIFGSDRGTDEASLPARPTIPGAASEAVTSETPDPGIRVKRHPKEERATPVDAFSNYSGGSERCLKFTAGGSNCSWRGSGRDLQG